jgi:hypothetical protein
LVSRGGLAPAWLAKISRAIISHLVAQFQDWSEWKQDLFLVRPANRRAKKLRVHAASEERATRLLYSFK